MKRSAHDARARPHLPGCVLLLVFLHQTSAFPAAPPKTFQDEVVEIVNRERWNNGKLPPLRRNTAYLDVSAQYHCEDMFAGNFFDHTSLNTSDPAREAILHFHDGETFADRIVSVGYKGNSQGENIAGGYGTPAQVMTAWMNSSGHKANILRPEFREIGVGFLNAGRFAEQWVQNFGRRKDVYPVVINREAYETASPQVNLFVYGGWALDMRFSNDGRNWSPWEPHAIDKAWALESETSGVKTAYCELRKGGEVRQVSDTIVLTVAVPNRAPTIASAPWVNPDTILEGQTTEASVVASDDSLPSLPGALIYTWEKDQGPGAVTFNPNGTTASATTVVSAIVPGSYTLRVTVSDGALSVTDTVTFTVRRLNEPPILTAGPVATPFSITIGATSVLSVLASDPDAKPSPLTYTWSKKSGPGAVTFTPNRTTGSNAVVAGFAAGGTYVLRVEVSDGSDSVTGEVTATVQEDPADGDGDGMPDAWELAFSLDPATNDAAGDLDGDGLSNQDEYARGTNPRQADSDADAMPDGWEVQYALDPTTWVDALLDGDGDKLPNADEYTYKSDPHKADTDADSLPDGWEVSYGLNPSRADSDGDGTPDGGEDNDGDGATNLAEFQAGTNPNDAASKPPGTGEENDLNLCGSAVRLFPSSGSGGDGFVRLGALLPYLLLLGFAFARLRARLRPVVAMCE